MYLSSTENAHDERELKSVMGFSKSIPCNEFFEILFMIMFALKARKKTLLLKKDKNVFCRTLAHLHQRHFTSQLLLVYIECLFRWASTYSESSLFSFGAHWAMSETGLVFSLNEYCSLINSSEWLIQVYSNCIIYKTGVSILNPFILFFFLFVL